MPRRRTEEWQQKWDQLPVMNWYQSTHQKYSDVRKVIEFYPKEYKNKHKEHLSKQI